MNDTIVTVQGYIGTEPEKREVGESIVASFRVASTPRRFNREQNAWVDLDTNWFTVNAWRSLAANAMASLHKGDAVLVTGRLRASVWQDAEGKTHQNTVVEAISVGHDLTRGTSVFLKSGPQATKVDDSELQALNSALAGEGPQVTSDGRIIEQEQPREVAA